MAALYIDADACPVRQEIYRCANKHNLMVWVVCNQWMNMPDNPNIRIEVVNDDFDAADNWIAERAQTNDIIITDDIPLAARCLDKGAHVLTNRGQQRNQSNIGEAMAMRELMSYVRASGDGSGGQKPLEDSDRRYFSRQLEQLIQTCIS